MEICRQFGKKINVCKVGRRGEKAEKRKKKALKNETETDEVHAEEVLPLEQLCKEVMQREEKMMTEGGLSEEDQTQLHQDLDKLWTQIRDEVQKTFSPDFDGAGLRAAVLCILQQEEMDRHWTGQSIGQSSGLGSSLGSGLDSGLDSGLVPGPVPVWRPNGTLLDHDELLWSMVQERLSHRPLQNGAGDQSKVESASTESEEALNQDSADVTEEVGRLAAQMRQDLVYIQKTVSPCYPDNMDILNKYLLLYHRCFSSHLQQLANASLNSSSRYCLLIWANHRYPRDMIDPELEGKVDPGSLGPLLPSDLLLKLQEQYLNDTQGTTQEWLQKVLKIETESWVNQSNVKPDSPHCYSFLAADVIQILDSSLLKVSCVGPEQRQMVTAHLDDFLYRYVQAVEEFVTGNHSTTASVLKAQLTCEEQFREFVLKQELDEQRRQSCLKSLNALRDCGYCSLTSGIRSKLKEQISGLWTAQWLDGSLPLVDSLLDFLDQKLELLTDLKPSCTQWVLGRLHRDVALRYFKNLLKTKRRNQKEQVGGANRMKDDVTKMDAFFTQQGSGSQWVSQLLLQVAEVLRLQDPDSVQLELVSLIQLCPDLSSDHISHLLLVKSGLSVHSIRSIKRSVKENRPLELSANQSCPFFSHLKVKWIKSKMSQLELNRFL
ncbi:hypothetical protein NQD34_001547 [Periophthalmus magnuspinnatus]|nr:hypothetical protein NQD34_001547 [Periophthalmus magnuspinnatus]